MHRKGLSKYIMCGLLVGFPLLATAGAAEGPIVKQPPVKRVVIPKLTGKPRIDGLLTEKVWREAVRIYPFERNDGKQPAREETELRLWYDDTALYLGWKCWDRDIQATFTERDSKFWEEEVAEFFVTPGRLDRYFELQWNPLGGMFDAIITNQMDAAGVSKNFGGIWGFTAPGMRSAVVVDGSVSNANDTDKYWQVEAVVPFADLERARPRPGSVWRGNFYRINRGKQQAAELQSWTPTLSGSFHQPSRFGYLEFGHPKRFGY